MSANDSCDSDVGLEEISVADSKKQVTEKWYSINKQLKAEKEKLKDKRRSHHLLCTQQKKHKSKNGKIKRKSSDEDSPEKLFESYKNVENKAKRVKFNDNEEEDIDDDDEEEEEAVVAEAEKLAKKPYFDAAGGDCSDDEEDDMKKSSEGFIAFDKKDGGVKPVCFKDFVKVDRGLESALAFKNKHLFGRHVHRQPMSNHLAMAEKRRARHPKKTNSSTL